MNKDEIRLRVARGSSFLDEHFDSRDWVCRINIEMLDCQSEKHNILGQLFEEGFCGAVSSGILQGQDVASLGFCMTSIEEGLAELETGRSVIYERLREVWYEVIQIRRIEYGATIASLLQAKSKKKSSKRRLESN